MNESTRATPSDSQFRDHAANERTLLAWIRTGIALMCVRLRDCSLRAVPQGGRPSRAGPRESRAGACPAWFDVVLGVPGLVTNAAAIARYALLRRSLELRKSVVPSPTLVYILGTGSVLVAIAMAVMLALSLRD